MSLLIITLLSFSAEIKYITELSDDNFEAEVLRSEQAVLVDFWAPWCGPCKTLGPIIEELAEENHLEMKFAKLNVDNNNKTAAAYGIRSIPTVGIFIGGKPVDGFVGLRNKEQIKEILKKHFRSEIKTEEIKTVNK
ncbi:MAG TPA: thioredoxin [Clostridiales bacterium]|nr:thioredoxin [Clostridiales bacterium]